MSEVALSTEPVVAPLGPLKSALGVGDRVAQLYVVVESSDERLRYRTQDWLLLLTVPLSIIGLFWNILYWIFILGLPRWAGSALRDAGLSMPLSSVLGIIFLGRSFDFDRRRGTVAVRRFYLFGPTISFADVQAVEICVTPPDASVTATKSDQVRVGLVDRQGAMLASLDDGFYDVAAWQSAAPWFAQVGRLVGCSLRIAGSPQQLCPAVRTLLEAAVAGIH
ncbi:MAG: hypothetical protein K8U03_15865 [Planctomycetia bacterium]|nr:hypothetical protein [Planctomycetia bacterium]